MSADDWNFPAAHVITLAVQPADIDAYDHVNNSVYLAWFDRAAWSHSAALGVTTGRCVELRRGMAAHRTEIDFDLAAVLGDEVKVSTWIVASDRKLRVTRRFVVHRISDGARLARATTDYVCINLDTGRAARMPELFMQSYVLTEAP
jgi:acyl-CoA thioester hydrolase